MSHSVGTVQPFGPQKIGPDSGAAPSSANTWEFTFAPADAPSGTRFLILHFQNVSLPAMNRLEVDLGWLSEMDVFTSADGTDFWTRPINVYSQPGGVKIRYITNGAATGSVELNKFGRGERQGATEPGHVSLSNCDPFQKLATYQEPDYDPFWFCSPPPQWDNVAKIPAGDVRAQVARS